jgi:hypothetical protein
MSYGIRLIRSGKSATKLIPFFGQQADYGSISFLHGWIITETVIGHKFPIPAFPEYLSSSGFVTSTG